VNEDRVWEMYFSSAYQESTREACRDRIDWFAQQARGRVLDLGCSQGLLPILLARAGHAVVGVDVDPTSIAFARQRLAEEPAEVQGRVELVLADGATWEPATRFDTVVLGEVLEHLHEPAAMVASARRLIADGGRLLVTVPMGWLEHHDHRQAFVPRALVDLLEPAFGIDALDVVDEKIRLVATADGASRPDVVAPARLAAMVDTTLIALQRRQGTTLAAERERLRAAVARADRTGDVAQRRIALLERRVAQLEGKVDKLAAEKKRLRESASYQLGWLLVDAGMRPRSAVKLPGKLASLAWTQLRKGAPSIARPTGPAASTRDVYAGRFQVTLPDARRLTDTVEGRVLHLLEYSLPHTQNGYTLRSFQIIQAQRQHGWDPVVITKPGFPGGIREPGPETVAGAPHYRLTGPPLAGDADLPRYIQAFAAEAAPILERVRPSIVHAASNFRNAYPALELARAYHLPFVYEVRGLWEETRVANGTLNRADAKFDSLVGVESYCARTADAVVTLGVGLKDELIARGVAAEKIFLVPNAVEAPAELPAPRPELLAELGLTGRFVVSYIGSVSPLESLHILVEAMRLLRARRRDLAALIVGDGSALEGLRALAARLEVTDCVRFVGSVPHAEIRDFYAITNAVACTRGRDRVCAVVTPLKPYEAMAYARPVIVSDIPALREMVTDGVNGRVVPAEDPAALARVIEQLADDAGAARALGERASAWVREHRTWRRVVEGYTPAYQYAREAFARRTLARAGS
jgi:glycosyltransferase involved in cell wall biosynthesis/2-polyprenyl-3-methyl-5-hydroxy-6-metoxy-1,4-benzoquinol methylase